MKSNLRYAKFYLQLWDGIWSIPLAIVAVVGIGFGIQLFYTDPTDMGQNAPGFWDPVFFQTMFYVAAIQVFVNFIVWLGMYFNFRGLFRYFKGVKQANSVVNKSKEDFLNLKAWQRLVLLLFVYCFLSVEFFALLLLLM
jgi:hypothetical protein